MTWSDSTPACSPTASSGRRRPIHLVSPVDLRDVTAEHVAGFDAVVHLGALSNDPLGSLAPELTYDVNHHASVRLARLAKDAGVRRFLYASTCSVYGASGGDALVDEDAPLRPVTPYAESKVRVEGDLVDLADDDFTPVSLRNATAFGFSPRLRADIVLNNLVGLAHLTGEARVMSDGTPWRPLVHARDIAAAFLAALTAPRDAVHARAFNVGTELNNLSVAEIAAEAVEAVPGSKLVITGESGPDPRSYRVDFSRIRAAMPDFTAEWTVKAGAVELARGLPAVRPDPGGLRPPVHPAGPAVRPHGRRHPRRHAAAAMTQRRGRADARAGRAPVPAVPEHHRRRRPGDAGHHRRVHSDCTGHEVPTGTQVLDWVVPKEWNIRDAYIADPAGSAGDRLRESNLHVVGYSVPVDDLDDR